MHEQALTPETEAGVGSRGWGAGVHSRGRSPRSTPALTCAWPACFQRSAVSLRGRPGPEEAASSCRDFPRYPRSPRLLLFFEILLYWCGGCQSVQRGERSVWQEAGEGWGSWTQGTPGQRPEAEAGSHLRLVLPSHHRRWGLGSVLQKPGRALWVLPAWGHAGFLLLTHQPPHWAPSPLQAGRAPCWRMEPLLPGLPPGPPLHRLQADRLSRPPTRPRGWRAGSGPDGPRLGTWPRRGPGGPPGGRTADLHGHWLCSGSVLSGCRLPDS